MASKAKTGPQNLAVALLIVGVALGTTGAIIADARQNPTQPVSEVASRQGSGKSGEAPFQNAKVERHSLSGSLSDEVQRWASGSTQPRWLGYAVPEVKGNRVICCGSYTNGDYRGNDCGTCKLEHHITGLNINSVGNGDAEVQLEASQEIAVMYRAESGKIGRIRVFSRWCVADAGGLDVWWLEGVKASESVNLLERLLLKEAPTEERGDSLGNGVLSAIALHADPAADRALESFASPTAAESLRRATAFWLGEARGADGLRTLEKMAKSDPSPRVREQVTFALSVSSEPGAVTEMIRMAHEDQSTQVRGQALFWLAQKAGKKAEGAITGAIENDPDTEVKKKAVFALSQLPREEGVPKLIQVAQTNKNPEVRKQAMFWLGQSEDPRALAFFKKVLSQ